VTSRCSTGKKVNAYGIAMNRIQNGKIVNQTAVYDVMALMMQASTILFNPLHRSLLVT
jgi:predicted ester cyclase